MSADVNEAEVFRLTKEEAAEILTNAAFEVTDPEDSYYGETIIHGLSGFLGRDWTLTAALDLLKDAQDIAWLPGFPACGHDLAVLDAEGRTRRFKVEAPPEVPR